ncbi:MAG: peptidase, partial [ANME-2 cluster archaeon]
MKIKILTVLIIALLGFIVLISGCIDDKTSESVYLETLDPHNVTTTWDLSFIYDNKEEALMELEALNQESESLNETFRPQFEALNGNILLHFLEAEKAFLSSIDNLWTFAYAHNSLNVTDAFYETFLADIQDLATKHEKDTSFATVKLSSLSNDEWNSMFDEEAGLDGYRAYLESNYIRFADHRPQNESHVAYLADLSNQQMKLETEALKEITTNVTMAGNITLENGNDYSINAQSYYALLSTDTNRNNRKKGYDKRLYHLINESDRMAQLYTGKARLDDRYARELNYSDAYEAKLFGSYLTKEQIDEMNAVFKERKDVFEPYNEFRKHKLALDQLRPYDLFVQLMEEPDRQYNYTDALIEIQASYAHMGPEYNDIFLETVTGNYIDVYPDPEGGKQPG